MRVLLTGASSFTGYWFAEALARAGHEVTAPLRRPLAAYHGAGARAERVRRLGRIAELIVDAPLGGEAFLEACRAGRFDVVCHHGAHVDDYRDPDFDPAAALAANTAGLPTSLQALAEGGTRGVVLTGSVFEPDEGAGDAPRRAVSPYGLSKGLTFQVFRYWCEVLGTPLAKFVIPNPFGPLEEPRYTAYLARTWLAGERAQVRTPLYVRDNIHVSLLAEVYAGFAEAAANAEGPSRLNPSGYVESQLAFTGRMSREMAARLGRACEFEALEQTEFVEPMTRVNLQPAALLAPGWSETAAWDEYASYLAEQPAAAS